MGLLANLFRRSLENPSTPLSAPDDWLFDSLGSFRASSGVNVNRETALTYDAYWRCVALISGDVAKLPLCVYQRTEGEDGRKGKEEDEGHPAYRLLQYEACPGEVDALAFKRTLTMHALTEGNGYAYILRDGAGRPVELWPLSPMKTYPVRENRRLLYVTEFGSNDSKQQRKLPAEDVFHLKGLSFDGLVGYSAVAKMREALGLGLAYENFGSVYFRNNARPNVVLKHPGRLKPEAKQNLRESWERLHSGLENANRTAVLEEGMDLSTVSINARDSQLLEGKSFSRTVIANFFGVPPHKVGESKSVSYNSLEQENEAYVEDGGGLGYWLPCWATECWRKLLTEQEKATLSHYFHFKTRHLLRANLGARTAYYTAMVGSGILCPDEARGEEGYDPRPDGLGGKFLRLSTLVPADTPAPDPNAAPPAAGDKGPPAKGQGKPPPKKGDAGRAARALVEDLAARADGAAKRPDTFLGFLDNLPLDDVSQTVRYRLLAAADCAPADLRRAVAGVMGRLAGELPAAAEARGKAPSRSIAEALTLLGQLPNASGTGLKARLAVLMPAHNEPPYDVDPGDLKDLPEKWVRLHELHATQPTVGREEVRAMIQGSLLGGHRGEPLPEGFPDDRPYVVKHKGKRYVHNGHHRCTAAQLLGMTKIKAYYYEDQ